MMNPPVPVTTESPMEHIAGFWSAAETMYDQTFAQVALELSDKVNRRVDSFVSSEGHTIKVSC